MRDAIKKAEAILVSGERAALAALLAIMVTLAFAQVALRQIGMRAGWSLSVLWGDTLLRHMVLWVGFLGAGVAAASDKQFAMDAAGQFLAGKAKARVALVCHLFAAAVCVGLARAAWAFLLQEHAAAETLFTAFGLDVRTWWLEAVAPVGFLLLLAHYLLKSAEAAAESFSRSAVSPATERERSA